MAQSVLFFSIIFGIYGTVEFYGWQAVKTAINPANIATAKWVYWTTTAVLLVLFLAYRPFLYRVLPKSLSAYFATFFVTLLLAKIVMLFFLLPEDLVRLGRFAISKFSNDPTEASGLTRNQFLSRLAIVVAAVPAGTLVYGVLANAYNYTFRKVSIKFPNLPDAFDGFRIIQLSDIHSGSFNRTEPLIEAVNKINAMNADLILFTGDLVNNTSDEMEPYMHIFDKLRAKHGVISTTGNHDYGDYYTHWDSEAEKTANFDKFKKIHKDLGWNLLMNQNVILDRNGQQIAILGIENWGKGHFSKHGRLDLAYKGAENVPFKLLMSHDPSHWDIEVRPKYPEIDLTLAGHTHGFQFGIENKWLKWSPSEYIYKQWAGLYQEGKQYIYVNRGFGFLGYPGRVGILPEVTEITLRKG